MSGCITISSLKWACLGSSALVQNLWGGSTGPHRTRVLRASSDREILQDAWRCTHLLPSLYLPPYLSSTANNPCLTGFRGVLVKSKENNLQCISYMAKPWATKVSLFKVDTHTPPDTL